MTTEPIAVFEPLLEKSEQVENVVKKDETAEKYRIAVTTDDLLDQIGIWHPYPLFITFSMAFLWCLSVMCTMSPSYMAPAKPCVENCTFRTVQDEFKTSNETFLPPGEMTSSIFFLGNGILGQVFAVLADRIGRRPVLVLCLFISGGAGVFASFAPTFITMLIGRFLQGSCFTVLTMVNWVMCCESISLSGHGYASVLFGCCWVLGYLMISPLAMLLSDWRLVQLFTSVPTLIFGIVMYFTLPESVSYLVMNKKRDGLNKWIDMASRVSSHEIGANVDQILTNTAPEEGASKSLVDVLKFVVQGKSILLNTILETSVWIVDFMMYTALSLSATSIDKSNEHVSYIFSGIVELPAYFILPAAIDCLGRKPTVMASHMISAFAYLSMYLFDAENDKYIYIIIWLTAKFSVTCSFMLCFVYGAELFPTKCRSICLGICATISNFGAMMAPHITIIDIWLNFPGMHNLFYALCSFICTILTTILPETKEHSGNPSQQQSIA